MVSVAIATYNGAEYLEQQMDSILNQTFQDFEIVISDDNSTDATKQILQSYEAKDKRIRVYYNEQNLGFKKNFEHAISLCKGDFIALSDQDDIWYPNHLELLLNAIGNNSLACGNSVLVDADNQELGMTLKYQESLDGIPTDNHKKLLSIILFRNPYQGATMLLSGEFVKKAMPIPDGVDYHDTWFASLSCLSKGLVYVDKPLIRYRRLSNSVTGIRNYRKSKIKRFIHNTIYADRKPLIQSLIQRVSDDSADRQLLDKLNNLCRRQEYHKHDLLRYMFELVHYKAVFSCDWRHWL